MCKDTVYFLSIFRIQNPIYSHNKISLLFYFEIIIYDQLLNSIFY